MVKKIYLLVIASVGWALALAGQPMGHTYQLTQGFAYDLPAEVSGGGSRGEVSRWQSETAFTYKKAIRERTQAVFGVDYEYSLWDFDGPEFLKETHALGVNMRAMHQFEDSDWGAVGMASLAFAGETEEAFWNGHSFGGGLGVSYRFNRNLTTAFGILIADTQERDVRYFPMILINWRINDRLNLQTSNGATLTYDVTGKEEWLLDAKVSYENDSYRAREQRLPNGQRQEPVVEDTAVRIEGGVTKVFNERFSVRVFSYGYAWRELELRDNDRRLATIDVDPSLGIGLSGTLHF